MSRPPFIMGGTSYDLSHLEPFTLSVTPKGEGAPTFKVLVTFSCHTFTQELKDHHPEDRRYVEGAEERCFCDVRHGYSANLPRIVNYAVGGRVFFSEGRNLLCVDWLPGLAAPYAVFFNMTRWREKGLDASMSIVSAYDKPALPDRLPAITFATLVSTVASGGKIKVPKDLRSIKK